MTITVNGNDAEPGVYIAGHHGQYAIDELAGVCDQFDIDVFEEDTPAYWRRGAEAEDSTDSIIVSNGPGRPGQHIARADECWDGWSQAGDDLEQKLNDLTEGGYWTWMDGELYLVQTEVEGVLYVDVRRDEGEDYDDAWQKLLDHGPDGYQTDYDALQRGADYHQFRITVHYEPTN